MVSLIETPTRLIVTGADDAMAELRLRFRYHPKNYFRSDAYQLFKLTGGEKGWDGYRYPLQLKTPTAGEMLRGRKPELLELCRQFRFKVNLERQLVSPFKDIKLADIPDGLIEADFRLDANQKQAVVEWLKQGMGVANMAVNSGKTATFAAAAAYIKRHFPDARFLYFTYAERLVKQVMDAMSTFLPDWSITQYGGGGKRDLTGKDMIIATQAILNRNYHWLDQQGFFKTFHALLLDESHHCFPAGTLVDGKPIESIKTGDLVWSVNRRGCLEQKKVLHRHKRRVLKKLLRIRTTSREIVCTEKHPIFVNKLGFLEAGGLEPGMPVVLCTTGRIYSGEKDLLLQIPLPLHSMPKDICGCVEEARLRQALQWPVPGCLAAQEGCSHYLPMRVVQEIVHLYQQVQSDMGEARRARLLLKSVLSRVSFTAVGSDDGQNESKIRVGAHEAQQSNEAAGSSGKSEASFGGLETEDSWRQWALHSPPGIVGWRIEVGDGSAYRHWLEAQRRVSDLLQTGHCESRSEDSSGSGWVWSHDSFGQGPGQKEDCFFGIERVESVEILEQRSAEEFGRVCPDGFVYNIEVEDNHTYFANDILVHNCQSPTAEKVLLRCAAYFRLAASDSLKESDPDKFNRISGLCGPVLCQVTSSSLIEQSRSAAPQLYLVDISGWRGKFRGVSHEPIRRSVAWTLVDNQWIKGTYLGPLYELDDKGKPKTKRKRHLVNGEWETTEEPIIIPTFHRLELNGVETTVPARFTLLDRRYDKAIIRFKERNQLICDWTKYYAEQGWNTVVVATRTTHVIILETLLAPLIPGRVRSLYGEASTSQRNEAFAWFKRTKGAVLVTPLIKEGVSINEIKAGVIADPVADWEVAKQIIGRFMRKKLHGDENVCHITWFIDSQHPRYFKNVTDLMGRLEKIEGFTFYHPVAGPETIGQALIHKGTS